MYNENEFEELPSETLQPEPVQPPRDKNDQPSRWKKTLILALCCALVGGAVGAGVTAAILYGYRSPGTSVSTMLTGNRGNTVIDIQKIDTDKLMTPAEVYAANVGSTVGITTSVTTNFWGYQTTVPASGSGFVLTEDGYVLTNYHVIDGSTSITVSMYDGTSYEASLVGYDDSNDIAVLKVDAEGLTPVILGDSDNLNVGDSVVAIGNPLGELTFSLTAGAISALERQITMSSGATMNLMQTDCAINSGNSGGALFNLYGEVIGITNAKYSSNGSTNEASIDNIGFAIPMNQARKIVESIIEKGYFSKPYIGVSVTDVSQETQSYGLPQGAAVKTVAENSPAQQAGLQVNDIITHVGDKALTGSQDLVSIVGKANVGDTLQLKVYRQGATIDITITIGEQIRSANTQQETKPQQNMQLFPNWGY